MMKKTISYKFRILLLILMGLLFSSLWPTPAISEVLYKTGWEHGSVGRSGVEDSGNPMGSMNEIGNTNQYGLGYVDTDAPFDGSHCLRIDWEKHGESEVAGACEWYVATPNVMPGVHEYYIGWAMKYPTNWENCRGRKLLYRIGGDQHSLFFSGTKGYDGGQGLTRANFWFKNKADTEDDDANQPRGEKLYYGGPRTSTYSGEPFVAWPGCEDAIFQESDGQWHTIILYVKESQTDGVYTMWFDGHKVLHVDKDSWNGMANEVDFFDNHESDFYNFKFPTYFNFGPPNHDQSEFWDNFIIATTFDEVAEYLKLDGGQQSPDTTPPTGSIVINSGASESGSTAVTLSLSASDSEGSVAQMQFSNNNVDWNTPEVYATSKNWSLSGGLGMKTVYVRFQDEAGNWSAIYSDTIELVESSGESSSKVFGSAAGADYPGTIEDTFINLNEENSFNSSDLNTYTWPVDSVANAIIMKINLATIPADTQIESAVLSVYMSGVDDGGGDDAYDVSVHKIVNHNPQLSQCTGYTYDGTHGWTPNDACYNSVPMAQADAAPAEDSKSLDKTNGYKSWNVTNMVRDWVANSETNFGLLLNSDPVASSDSNRIFASSEAADSGQRPKLVVTYSTSGGSLPDTTPPAAPSGLGVGVH